MMQIRRSAERPVYRSPAAPSAGLCAFLSPLPLTRAGEGTGIANAHGSTARTGVLLDRLKLHPHDPTQHDRGAIGQRIVLTGQGQFFTDLGSRVAG